MSANPKPEPYLLVKRRRAIRKESLSKAVKRAVMFRDQRTCRVCGKPAESVHEIRFRSLGGQVALGNSIAVCGDGVRKCHGKLQRNEILVIGGNANGHLRFIDNGRKAKPKAKAQLMGA